MGIGIKADAAGMGIPASDISVRYRIIPVPECVPLFGYRTGSGITILFLSGTGLTRCQTVRHLHPARTYYLWWKDTLARPYCWWWKDTLHVHTNEGRETSCTAILLMVDRHLGRPFCWWWTGIQYVWTSIHVLWSVRYHWSRICPALLSYAKFTVVWAALVFRYSSRNFRQYVRNELATL